MTRDNELTTARWPLLAAVYNSRNPRMFLFPSRLRFACCLLLLVTHFARATDWRRTETELAEKISAATGPGVIALEVINSSSLSSSDAEQIRRDLTDALANSGARISQPDQAAVAVRVTLSENLQNYVWVAEIQQSANDASVAIVSTPRPPESVIKTPSTFPLTLHATQLVSQPFPILDAAILEGNPRRMLVLGESAVTVFEFKDGRWLQGESLAVNHDRPFPRDVRGRIVLRKDHLFDAYLPGLICHSTNNAPLAVSCLLSDDPWPLQTEDMGVSAFFAPARNFFIGALVPGIGQQKSAPAFYSAAAVPRGKYALWIFSGVDGQIDLLDGRTHQIAGNVHWGSDLAGIHAACRQDWQVLATSAENGSNDSVQAFEVPGREPVPVSPALELNGAITALWTSRPGDSAIAVYRDSNSGNYEAVQLNLTCGQ